jgi:hypothetical protein
MSTRRVLSQTTLQMFFSPIPPSIPRQKTKPSSTYSRPLSTWTACPPHKTHRSPRNNQQPPSQKILRLWLYHWTNPQSLTPPRNKISYPALQCCFATRALSGSMENRTDHSLLETRQISSWSIILPSDKPPSHCLQNFWKDPLKPHPPTSGLQQANPRPPVRLPKETQHSLTSPKHSTKRGIQDSSTSSGRPSLSIISFSSNPIYKTATFWWRLPLNIPN